jgi:hypothetical protein
MKHTILFLAANPRSTSEIALGEECAAIEDELSRTPGHADFDVRSGWAVSVDGMMRHLNARLPTVLHFSGHGSGAASQPHAALHRDIESRQKAGIFLHDGGVAQYVSDRALARMIKGASPATRLVVLNACYTAAFGESLRQVVDCVIGIDGAIEDGTARAFAVALYRALGYRCSISKALEQALATLDAKQLPDHLPVCHMRDGLLAEELFLLGAGQRPGQIEEMASGPSINGMPWTAPDETVPLPNATASESYDVFLAHPSLNKATADALFDLLHPDLRVFLGVRSLPTSEHWDQDVFDAHRASRATVLLLSSHCDAAWYLGDEVLTAIALSRASPATHRLMLLLLEPGVTVPHNLKHGVTFDVAPLGGLDSAAARLRSQLVELRKQAPARCASSRRLDPASPARARRDYHALYDRLLGLPGGIFEQIVTHARKGDPASLAPRSAAQTERALDLAQNAALDPMLCRRLVTELDRRAPWTRR